MIAKHVLSALLYGVLLVAALLFLAPVYGMLATSFKDAEQIRTGNLLSWPTSINFEAWSLSSGTRSAWRCPLCCCPPPGVP